MDPHGDQPLVECGEPLGTAPVMIMLHGRGATPDNILELIPRFGRSGWTYLAPTAAGRTWYPLSFMATRELNEPGLSSALGMIARLTERVFQAGVLPSQVVLLGFSQGACLTAEFAARHPKRYGGVVIFSGGLIGAPGSLAVPPGSLENTPVFLGCSDVDAHVPRGRVDESAEIFKKMGANTTCRIYPGMGHLVSEDEIILARQMMQDVDGKA